MSPIQSAIPIADLPHFSDLYKDFVAVQPVSEAVRAARQAGTLLSSASSARKVPISETKRDLLMTAISRTMEGSFWSDKQHLYYLYSKTAQIVLTGQQIGFLGGPLYTLLKCATAIGLAKKWHVETGEQYVPMLWIEDNDHDYQEAAGATVFDTSRQVCPFAAPIQGQAKFPTAERYLTEEISGIVQQILETLELDPQSECASLLSTVYTPGKAWTQAFVQLLSRLFSPYGLLFVSAAELRTLGAFRDVIVKDIETPGLLQSCVEEGSSLLESMGYSRQAEARPVNTFYHDSSTGRTRIELVEDRFVAGQRIWTREEMTNAVALNPESFSGNVLLRPLCQDWCIEPALYVGGPAEIAYLQQVRPAYVHFGTTFPDLAGRCSVTFVPAAVSRNLTKLNVSPEEVVLSVERVRDALIQASGGNFAERIGDAGNVIADVLESLSGDLLALDASLTGTLGSTKAQVEKALEGLHKKVNSAIRRREEITLTRLNDVHSTLLPFNVLQERTIAVFWPFAVLGQESFSRLLDVLIALPPETHFFVGLNPEKHLSL